MPTCRHPFAVALAFMPALAAAALGDTTVYTDEGAFLAALAAHGYAPVHEGFEDDAAWGGVRSTVVGGPHSAPSVTNLGITWSSSSASNGVSTSNGAARTGQWGFYSLPHGDYAHGITDGWRGTAGTPMVAIGGWVRTNTPIAGISMFLDGNEADLLDFGGDNVLNGPHRFFGVVRTEGFTVFDYRETEGQIDDQKFIFGDDFTFAFDGVLVDCNENGVADGLDVTNGASADCNGNLVPDECEIDANSPAPGGPFYCTEGCAEDCDGNGVIDACETTLPELHASGVLTPIGAGSPQSFVVPDAQTAGDVVVTIAAYATLGGSNALAVTINGVPVGTLFGTGGHDCPENGPDVAQLVVPEAVFDDAVGGGDATITVVGSAEVDPQGCDLPTFVTIAVELRVPSPADANGNGILDACECPADLDGDAAVSFGDLLELLAAWGSCAACPADLDHDGAVGFADLLVLLGAWGPC